MEEARGDWNPAYTGRHDELLLHTDLFTDGFLPWQYHRRFTSHL